MATFIISSSQSTRFIRAQAFGFGEWLGVNQVITSVACVFRYATTAPVRLINGRLFNPTTGLWNNGDDFANYYAALQATLTSATLADWAMDPLVNPASPNQYGTFPIATGNLWGLALDTDWVSDPTFGVQIRFGATSLGSTVSVDSVALAVRYDYEEADTLSGGAKTKPTDDWLRRHRRGRRGSERGGGRRGVLGLFRGGK